MMDRIRGLLEEQPGLRYGTVLPMARDPQTGEYSWAVPGMAREAALGILDLLEGPRTGELTPRAMLALPVASGVAARAGGMPAGALGAQAGRRGASKLPADTASRHARAREQGYRLDDGIWVHGTKLNATQARKFRGFDPLMRGKNNRGLPTARVGTWFGGPDDANWYAFNVPGRGNSVNIPVVVRSRKTRNLVMDRPEWNIDIARTINDAWADGVDRVILTFPDGSKQMVVKNENQVRSPHAMFDPAKMDSTDLLAAGGSPAFAAGFTVPQQAPRKPSARGAGWRSFLGLDDPA